MKKILSTLTIIMLMFVAFPTYSNAGIVNSVTSMSKDTTLVLTYNYINNYAVGETDMTYLGTDTATVSFTFEDGANYITVSWINDPVTIQMYIQKSKEFGGGYAFLCGNENGEAVTIVTVYESYVEVYFLNTQKKYVFYNQ